jgi:hypothetical protein
MCKAATAGNPTPAELAVEVCEDCGEPLAEDESELCEFCAPLPLEIEDGDYHQYIWSE